MGETSAAFSTSVGVKPIIGQFGKCVSVANGSSVAGSALVLRDCNDTADQLWQRTALNQFKGIGGKCIRTKNGASANGTPAVLGVCGSGAADEVWTFSGEFLKGPGGKCINVHGGIPNNETPLTMWDCVTGAANEKFTFSPEEIQIRVQAVAMADTNGTNAATITPTQFKSWIDESNKFTSRFGIRLIFSDASPSPDWIVWKDSQVNALNQDNQDAAAESRADAFAKAFPGKAVFLLTHAATQGGYSQFLSENFIVFNGHYTNAKEWAFVPHEFGHFSGLMHTLAAAPSNQAETTSLLNANAGSEAQFDGDAAGSSVQSAVADTPPDPGAGSWLDPSKGCTTDNDVPWNGGTVHFAPDKFNTMSYWGCADFHRSATPDQITAMRNNLMTHPLRSHLYLDSQPKSIKGVATMKTQDGRSQAMAVGSNLAGIWKTTTNANSNWTYWVNVASSTPVSGPAAGMNLSDGRGEIFVVASDGSLKTRWQNSSGLWVDWTAVGAPTALRDVASSKTSNGRPRIYVVGTNGHVYVMEKTTTVADSAWSSWQDITPSGVSVTRATVGILPDKREELFVLGSDQKLYTTWQTTLDGAWSGVASMTSSTATDVEAGYTSDGRLQLFITRASDGRIFSLAKTTLDPNSAFEASWSAVGSIGTFASLASLRLADGRPEVIAVTTGGVSFTTFWNGSAWDTFRGF